MLYTSERNYGCRFLEVSLNGLRTIILENEKIRVMLLLDKGTEIIEFNYKETDTDFVWRSPQGLSCLRKSQLSWKDDQYLTDQYTGGWFEAFPSLKGSSTDYRGAHIQTYGEVCYLPWEYIVCIDEPGEVQLKFFVKTVKTPFFLEKTLSIKSGIPSLFINERVTNLGNETMDFEWGYHPIYGSPFLDGNCLIDLPGGELNIYEQVNNSRVDTGIQGQWPVLEGKNGKEVDFSRMLPPGQGVMDLLYLSKVNAGWAAVRNISKGVGIGMAWDKTMFENCMLWIVSNGDEGYPRYGDTYALSIFPRNIEGVAALGKKSTACNNSIKKSETISTWLIITAFKGNKKVGYIDKDGIVRTSM